jgi:imidazole glycerol-phosphate synthase subunit HisH
MKKQVAIIDLSFGSVLSIKRIIEACGYSSYLVSTPDQVINNSILILPGVGSWDDGMRKLNATDWVSYLKFSNNNAMIGICLGFQLLFDSSEEGSTPGLGLIPGDICKVPSFPKVSMGWRKVTFQFDYGVLAPKKFYHVHKYGLIHENSHTVGVNEEGINVCVRSGNLIGVQFHPEKSHAFGKELLTYLLGELS